MLGALLDAVASEGIFGGFQPLLPVFTALFRLLTSEKERWKKLRVDVVFIHTADSLSHTRTCPARPAAPA